MQPGIYSSSVLIFGAGVAGQNALEHLSVNNKVIGFVDNNPDKQGCVLHGLPVISPEQLSSCDYDQIAVASEFFEKIVEQLIQVQLIDPQKIQVLPSSMLTPMSFGQDSKTRQSAEQILLFLTAQLQQQQLGYFIDAGTLLGLYRDGQLIPWDDDLDIGVLSIDRERVKSCLDSLIPPLDKLSGGKWVVETHYCQQDYGIIKQGDVRSYKLKNQDPSLAVPMIDIFIKYIHGDTAEYTLASRGVSVPSKHMFNLSSIQFRQQALSIPSDPEGYLEAYYGDWKTPVKNWNIGQIKNTQTFD